MFKHVWVRMTSGSAETFGTVEHFERALKCIEEIIETAISLGGVLSGEHGIGLEKQRFLKKAMDPAAIDIMKQIKDLLDPKHILNPGKIWEETPHE